MPFWDWEDSGPVEETAVRHLAWREMLARLARRIVPERRALALGLAVLLVSVAAELLAPLVLRRLIDRDIPAAGTTGVATPILHAALLYLGLLVAGSIAGYTQIAISSRMGLSLIRRLKEDLFTHLLGLGADYFDRHTPGRLLARVESDTERLQVLFSEVTLSLVRSSILMVGTLVILFRTSALVSLAVIGLIAPFFALALLYMRAMRPWYGRTRQLWSRISSFVSEYVQAVPILQVYGREQWALAKLRKANRDRYALESKTEFIDYGFWSLFYTVEVGAVMLILWLGFGRAGSPILTLGTTVLFVEYTRRLFFPIVLFAEQLHFMQKAFASADRVMAILATESRVQDPPDAIPEIPEGWREIRFEEVSFAYDGEAAHGARALDRVSFRIGRGERVALVGPSGGGKTTVTNLLLRFYEPTSGRITIDGVDLRRYAQKGWRDHLGLVLQEIHLFPGTVLENLRTFREDVDPARIQRALGVVGAEEILARLPGGLAASLAEGGQNLSMGERQILSFARALVRDPDLLILDEATSSVDPQTERRIQASIERLLAGRTSLVVAHRLSTVVAADRILVLQRGRIVEEGSHRELLESGGVYQALYDLQFRAEVTA